MSDGGLSGGEEALLPDREASVSSLGSGGALVEALLDAAYEGDRAALLSVLEQRTTVSFDIDAKDGTGATAFVVACMSDERAELIQPLLDAGCAVDCRYSLGANTGTG